MGQIVPDSRPQLSEQQARDIIDHAAIDEKVVLLGIRGYYKQTMGNPVKNDVGIYDDAIFLIAPGLFVSFNANTDPSVMHAGVAVLKPGIHYYKMGDHHIGKPNAYPALRPASPDESVPVTRDGKDSRGIAINIHRGSLNGTSSEGCQTIYPNQYANFIALVYAKMGEYKQKQIPYYLIEY
jgi:hypothetical protein